MSQLGTVVKEVVGLSALLVITSNGMQRAIMHDEFGFKVRDNGCWHQVHNYDVDPKLRKMNPEQLRKFLATGCLIRAKQLNNGDFVLRSHVPGKGGGPITGAIAGCATAVTGAVATTCAFVGCLAAGAPSEAFQVAVKGASLTAAATIAATEAGLMLPLP